MPSMRHIHRMRSPRVPWQWRGEEDALEEGVLEEEKRDESRESRHQGTGACIHVERPQDAQPVHALSQLEREEGARGRELQKDERLRKGEGNKME
jgi:hypothetical protein